jgi:hypothetical protein
MNFILKSIASSRILALAIIAVMVVWLVISCFISLTFTHAAGRVERLVQKGSGNEVYYYPVTVFRDAVGTEHTIQSSGGSNPPRFPVGTAVTVLYRRGNPDAGMIQDRFVLWIAPLLFIAIGIFYTIVGNVVGRWLQNNRVRNAT